jgi:hypothetical protein
MTSSAVWKDKTYSGSRNLYISEGSFDGNNIPVFFKSLVSVQLRWFDASTGAAARPPSDAARGLEVSLPDILKDPLVQRQPRHQPPPLGILLSHSLSRLACDEETLRAVFVVLTSHM